MPLFVEDIQKKHVCLAQVTLKSQITLSSEPRMTA
jgi:hypothetical protein